MIDIICNSCNGCSSTRQLSSYPRYSFPKKLLVAIALVYIITMIVTPTESRKLEKTRHRHPKMVEQEEFRSHNVDEVRIRHQRMTGHPTRITKDTTRPKIGRQRFKKEMRKAIRKVMNTKSHLKINTELERYSESAPEWLPKVNFVDIHIRDYTVKIPSDNSRSKLERKFKYLMPRLYKSLVEYEDLFKLFQRMDLDFPDTPTNSYKMKRKNQLKNILHNLYSTIQEVNDSMIGVNVTIPNFKKKDFSTIATKVDETECLRIDFLAYRGYSNLLQNWLLEMRCTIKSRHCPPALQNACVEWDAKLRNKKSKRQIRGS